jgi:hypothetical protein
VEPLKKRLSWKLRMLRKLKLSYNKLGVDAAAIYLDQLLAKLWK